ncbi:hypothetical protein VNI00_017134 [Paramarasmius palmivorus]|uniref:Uncharacterized protein n=1 Tax=Paramarasmius palmivorus TaxID=297713 RepID=A0AAW0B7F8_9AGAR
MYGPAHEVQVISTLDTRKILEDAADRGEEDGDLVSRDAIDILGGAGLQRSQSTPHQSKRLCLDSDHPSHDEAHTVIPGVMPISKLASLLDATTLAKNPEQFRKEHTFILQNVSHSHSNPTAESNTSALITKAKRTPAQQRRQDKKHLNYREKRKGKREADQEEGATIKACAAKHVAALQSSGLNIKVPFQMDAREWVGPSVATPQRKHIGLGRYLGIPGMQKIAWPNVRQSRVIRGVDGMPYALLAGWPSDEWPVVMKEVQRVLQWAHERLKFDLDNRRGDYDTIGMGLSMGGGQDRPQRLRSGDEGQNGEILDEVRGNWAVKRVARYHDSICDDETRWAFVQFTAAALVRWVHNGCLTDLEFMEKATLLQKKEWQAHHDQLGEVGLSLLRL